MRHLCVSDSLDGEIMKLKDLRALLDAQQGKDDDEVLGVVEQQLPDGTMDNLVVGKIISIQVIPRMDYDEIRCD